MKTFVASVTSSSIAIADYREKVPRRAQFPRDEPGDSWGRSKAAAAGDSRPIAPEPFDAVLYAICSEGDPPSLLYTSRIRRFFGYFPSNSSLAAVLGDYVSTGLAQLGLNWQASPALTELEELTTDWLRQMVDLSAAWSGVIQDTASTTTLVALLCARERATNYGAARGGLQESEQPLVVYASSQSHSSVDKAALLAGFGRNNIHASLRIRSMTTTRCVPTRWREAIEFRTVPGAFCRVHVVARLP